MVAPGLVALGAIGVLSGWWDGGARAAGTTSIAIPLVVRNVDLGAAIAPTSSPARTPTGAPTSTPARTPTGVPAASATPTPNVTATVVRLDAARSQRVDALVNAQVGANAPGGSVLVVRGGQVVHEVGYGLADVAGRVANASNTRFHLASVGKQFTALGIVMLKEEGKLRYDESR